MEQKSSATRRTLTRNSNGSLVSDLYGTDVGTSALWNEPPLVRGEWVTLPGGSRFRTATNYGRVRTTFIRGNGGSLEAHRYLGSSLSQRQWRTESAGGFISNFTSGNWAYQLNNLGIPNIHGAPSFKNLEQSESITKALADIADQKANIAENLATLRMTARMFINPVRSYVAAVNTVRRYSRKHGFPGIDLPLLNARQIKRLARQFPGFKGTAEAYLTYIYGFKPLMQDVYGVAELMKACASKPLLFRGRGVARRNDWLFDKYLSTGQQDEYWKRINSSSRTRTVLTARINEDYAFTRTLNQLGLVNPASLAWELVPFSFVIDWLLPVGPVLGAMSAPAGLTFVGGSSSRRVTATWDYETYMKPSSGVFSVIKERTPSTGSGRYEGYTRQRLTSWPVPGLYIASDPLGLTRDGSDRGLKAVALALANMPRTFVLR